MKELLRSDYDESGEDIMNLLNLDWLTGRDGGWRVSVILICVRCCYYY